jgi:hypothetical protein
MEMTKRIYLLAILVLPISVANAALQTFTDRATWQAALGGVGDLFEDFSSFTDNTFRYFLVSL